MGCGSSNPAALLEYQRQIEELRLQLKNQETKSHEEENLLRFKVEVLVNMLTVEEQRNEIATKRLETLKWLVSTSNDLDSVRQLLHSAEERQAFDSIVQQSANAEIGEAVEMMRRDFAAFKEDIFTALAAEDGHIVSSLPRLDFMKQVYSATEHIQKSELQLLAARFDDGSGSVNVPEFLDFFCTPQTLRSAKAAANAVRMSLDLLALQQDVFDKNGGNTNGKDDAALDLADRRSHITDHLDRSAKRLAALWLFVRAELLTVCTVLQEEATTTTTGTSVAKDAFEDQVLRVEIFEKALLEICGPQSQFLRRLTLSVLKDAQKVHRANRVAIGLAPTKRSRLSQVNEGDEAEDEEVHKEADEEADEEELPTERLQPEDVSLLSRRFELGGVVSLSGFAACFDDIAKRQQTNAHALKRGLKEDTVTGVSPFRWSTEWTELKQTSLLHTRNQLTPPPAPPKAPPAAPPAAAPKVAESKVTEPKVAEPKVPQTPIAPQKQAPTVSEAPTAPAEEKKGDVAPDGEKKTAPAVDAGFCGCLGSNNNKNTDAKAEAKRPEDPPIMQTPQHKQAESKTEDKGAEDKKEGEKKEGEGKKQEDELSEEDRSKAPLPRLKHSEEFSTPVVKRSNNVSSNRNVAFLPERDGLGHEDAPLARNNISNNNITNNTATANARRNRLRRHEDRAFDRDRGDAPEHSSDEENNKDHNSDVRFGRPRQLGK